MRWSEKTDLALDTRIRAKRAEINALFCAKVREHMETHEITQTNLAQQLGVTKQALNLQLSPHKKYPSGLDSILRITEALNLEVVFDITERRKTDD